MQSEGHFHLKSNYHIAFKIDVSQEVEVLKTRQALNSVRGQVQDLQAAECF